MNIFKKPNHKDITPRSKKPTFVKTNTKKPEKTKMLFTAEQKTKLIKKGNNLLNKGDIDNAHKIFKALQSYDGLMRVSKTYYKNGQGTQSYIAACQAGAHRDVTSLGKAIAGALRVWITPKNTVPITHLRSAKNQNIQLPNPQNVSKILALAKANKNINYS